jgi:hypothetical protein
LRGYLALARPSNAQFGETGMFESVPLRYPPHAMAMSLGQLISCLDRQHLTHYAIFFTIAAGEVLGQHFQPVRIARHISSFRFRSSSTFSACMASYKSEFFQPYLMQSSLTGFLRSGYKRQEIPCRCLPRSELPALGVCR